MALHKDATEVHVIANWEPADATALAAISPADVNDEGKVAWQQDDDSLHLLVDWTGPTWQAIDAGGGDVSGPATSTDIGVISSVVEDAVTNAFTELLQLTHNSSGTPAAGLGAAIEMLVETSTTTGVSVGQLAMEWAVITHASRRGQLRLLLDDAGTATEVMVLGGPSQYGSNAIGNARGEAAVDLQGYRSAATQVAGGSNSALVGGDQNTASAASSAVLGGTENEIDAGAPYAVVLGGFGAKASFQAQVVNSNIYFANPGDMQGTIQVCASEQVTHSDASWYKLWVDAINDYLVIPSDTCWVFDILLAGATSGMGKSFGFHIRGMIENDGGTTTLKGTPVVTVIDDSDDTSFDARVTADDTNDALLIEVSDSDGASDVVNWLATIRTSEITFL
jgi:hypothetical protein